MRVCCISDCPSTDDLGTEMSSLAESMLPVLMPLAQAGHTISWVTCLPRRPGGDRVFPFLEPTDTVLPPTCRYVLPCHGYTTVAALQVIDIDLAIWQRADLHTRLFTFLRLLQDAVLYDVWHVWGTLPVVYLAVYTARLLHIPVVVSYHAALLHEQPCAPFLWEWLGQHVRHLVVSDPAEPQLPFPSHLFPQACLYPVPLATEHSHQHLATLYANVAASLTL